MTRDEAIKILEIERECVSRDCNKGCAWCDLGIDRKTILGAYDLILKILTPALKNEDYDPKYYNLFDGDRIYSLQDAYDLGFADKMG